MNNKNRGVVFYPHLFLLQRIDLKLVRFETELLPLKCVDDLQHLNYMRLRSRFNNAEIFSTVMSEGNGKIFNTLLKDLYDENDFAEETKLFKVLYTNFELLKV